jgi:hypothetical protein
VPGLGALVWFGLSAKSANPMHWYSRWPEETPMNASHLPMASLVISTILVGAASLADEPAPAAGREKEGHVSLAGRVLMSAGSPAQGATVAAAASSEEPVAVARSDASGRFQLRGIFGNGAQLHARSADGKHQTTLRVSAIAVRASPAAPVELTLVPAVEHEVTVVAEGRPVDGARVAASGIVSTIHGVTGSDGKVLLLLPANDPIRDMVAWHPTLGVGGRGDRAGLTAQNATQLSLLPPTPLKIQVVDPAGNPVSGLELGASFANKVFAWALASKIDQTWMRTDVDGSITLSWAPREGLRTVDVDLHGFDWKKDKIDLERLGDRIVTVHARRRVPVEGRLVMPEGANPEGILITGHGFGPGNIGDIPNARARADGSFTIRVSSDHAYVIGIADLEWASELWSGVILAKETSKPAEITMSIRHATPVTVRVTRGQERTPIRNAFVEVGTVGKLNWVDASGRKRSAMAGVRPWLRTDDNGEAQAGVGRGKLSVRLSSGAWDEEREFDVSSEKPVAVEFHRAWPGERSVAGRLKSGGRPFQPSPRLVARAWAPRPHGWLPELIYPKVAPDGTFSVAFDAESLVLFFNDPEKRRSGFAEIGWKKPTVELKMEPTATYSGTLQSEEGQPLAGQRLSLFVTNGGSEAVAIEQTDKAGRFRFDAVPVSVPLSLSLGNGVTRSEYILFDHDRFFTPGEARENDELRPSRRGGPPVARPKLPLPDLIANTCRNVRPAGMLALVILKGDESQEVTVLTGQVQDYELVAAVLNYLPVVVEPAELKTEAATLSRFGWPVPEPGKIVLVALNGDQQTIATKTIGVDPPTAALASADVFLKQHKPPTRDALACLAAARDEARKTGRRVWVVHGGPRCAPCFRLGRWMDDNHATLEKDFVIVKVMGGLDAHASEALKDLPQVEGNGIPWHAITEPDGKIVVTSHGPVGNIGFPSSVEGIRHLRQMLDRTIQRLTTADVDGLIKSVSGKR